MSSEETGNHRLRFYLTAAGTACGLGNLWRFPYLVAENGGGAFLFIYLLVFFTLGLSLLVGEIILGQSSKRNIIGTLSRLSTGHRRNKWLVRFVGYFSIFMAFAVLVYYTLISGWLLHFIIQYGKSIFFVESEITPDQIDSLLHNFWMQVLICSVHIILLVTVLIKKINKIAAQVIVFCLPVFLLLLFFLVYQSVTLPHAGAALRYLLYPDFSALSQNSLLAAIGHCLFSLSVGFGTLMVITRYLPEDEYVPAISLRVAYLDLFISLLAVFFIFPIVFGSDTSSAISLDPALVFKAITLVYNHDQKWLGLLFFICLYLSALTASFSLTEGLIVTLQEERNHKRRPAVTLLGIALLIGVIVIAAALNLQSQNSTVLIGYIDEFLIQNLLPLVGLGLSIILGFIFSDEEKRKYFINPQKIESHFLYKYWIQNLQKWIPFLIILGFLLLFCF